MRVLVVAGFALLALTPAAHADVTIGSALTGAPGPASLPIDCAAGDGCTLSPSVIPGREVKAPTGVVTRWAVRSGTNVTPVAFQVLRAAGGGFVEAGRSPVITPPADAVSVHPVRISVQSGDRIGLECCASSNAADFVAPLGTATLEFWPAPVTGSPGTSSGELQLQATIEPDGDADGFGDETQDGCPTVAGVAPDGCPPAPPPPPPPATPRVNQPPTVRFRSPLAGTAIGTSQRIELEVSDDASAPTVSVFDDDGTICTVSAEPYACTWTPTGADVGRATLLASAVDSDGRSTLGIVRVKVSRFKADLTRRVRGRVVSGRLTLPAAVERSLGCTGQVTVRRGKVRRTVALKRNCTYSVRLPRGRGTPRARFAGNPVVEPAT